MKINKDKFYAIIKKDTNGTVTFFNNRIYSGRYVMSAYTQIPNKEHYQIAFIHYNPLKEATNEN